MVEFDNVREALEDAFELTEVGLITVEGREIEIKDLQELFAERLCNIADLLGLEQIYLN